MVNPQLLQYVRAQRAAGVSKEDIVKALATGGWSAQDANEAFAALDVPPPPTAPKPPPPPPMQTTPQMSTMSPAMQARTMPVTSTPMQQPMSVRPPAAAVVQPRPSSGYPAQKRRTRWGWIFFWLLIFFILGMGAGAYAAVTYDWFGDIVSQLTGIEQPLEEDMNMVADEGDTGGFLEVSPVPFDSTGGGVDNGTSTPATTTPATTTPQGQ
jgi:hypothetical protein